MNLNNLNLNLKGNELTLRKTELTKTSASVQKMTDAYDEHAKLVFIFDVSGSMGEEISKTVANNYYWRTGVVDEIRKQVSEAVARLNGALIQQSMPAPDDAFLSVLADSNRDQGGLFLFTPNDDELKGRVVRAGALMLHRFGVQEPISYQQRDEMEKSNKNNKKIDVVRNLARQEIRRRFEKYPKARIGVIAFGDQAVTIFDDGDPEDLWPHLDRLTLTNSRGTFQEFVMGGTEVQATSWNGTPMVDDEGKPIMEIRGGKGCGGGTEILNGLREAMEICRNKPSKVGIHHFILVSDGEDYTADREINGWVPAMKASGIVLDYIHIGSGSPNDGVAEAARKLGGTMVQVTTEEELKEKFIEAAQRLCLPPASV